MSLFEALYGRNYNTLVNWDGPLNKVVHGLEMIKEMEQQIVGIRQNLKTSQDRKKSYAYLKRSCK